MINMLFKIINKDDYNEKWCPYAWINENWKITNRPNFLYNRNCLGEKCICWIKTENGYGGCEFVEKGISPVK